MNTVTHKILQYKSLTSFLPIYRKVMKTNTKSLMMMQTTKFLRKEMKTAIWIVLIPVSVQPLQL